MSAVTHHNQTSDYAEARDRGLRDEHPATPDRVIRALKLFIIAERNPPAEPVWKRVRDGRLFPQSEAFQQAQLAWVKYLKTVESH